TNEGETYVLSYQRDSSRGADGVESATLTLTKDTFHVIAQTVVLTEGGEQNEFTFREETLEPLPARSVASNVFEPQPALLGARDIAPPALMTIPSAPRPSPPPPVPPAPRLDVDRLELDAWYRVHRLESCLSPLAAVERLDGSVRIDARVTSQAC